MKSRDYSTHISTDASLKGAFKSINNVSKWWTADFEGHSEELNDIFTVHFGETYVTIQLVELIPDEKIGWLVIDCNKPWLKDKKEWNGTQMSWEIFEKGDKTQIRFTHLGLVPEMECYGVCENAWTDYLQISLANLINADKE
ncbi:MAG: SRPBCC domain-containing protein [Bacteroidota bacterium]